MEYSAKELAASAGIFLNELLQLREGEHLLVFMDHGSDVRVAHAIEAQAERRGCQTEILELNSASPLAEQADQLAGRIRRGSFEAICELSQGYFYLTDAWKAARERGARIYCVGGLDAPAFIRCVGTVNHERMFEFGVALRQLLEKSRSLRVTTNNGTDIRMQFEPKPDLPHRLARRLQHTARKCAQRAGLAGLAARLSGGASQSFIGDPCGVLDGETRGTFLDGQLSFRGIPATIEGTAVIDGYMWPPSEIGLLDEPLLLKFEKGSLTNIGGCPIKSKILTKRFEGQTIQVEHFCVGFNPGARWSGRLLEVERVFGALTIGIGQRFLHTDGVLKKPTLIVDENVIEENGLFVSEELVRLQKDLVRNEAAASNCDLSDLPECQVDSRKI